VYNAGTDFRGYRRLVIAQGDKRVQTPDWASRLFLSGGETVKVIIDHDRCEGNARCVLAAPDVFELRNDDQSYVLIERPGENLRSKIEEAARFCPRQAIALIEE
jgi:ferredoxin